MFNKKIFYFLFFIFLTTFSSANINIKYKIGDEIITNYDIINEKNYLVFLRPNLSKLSEKELLRISENSLIREIIKKRELDRIFKNIEDTKFIEDIKKNLFLFKNVKSEAEFIALLKQNNIEYEKIIEKIRYEGLWNELISLKYKSLVRINKTNLKKKLEIKKNENKKFEYELYEILFDVKNLKDLKMKHNNILKFIKLNGFKSAASKFSISNSSNKGGDIGWIKETFLSEEIVKLLRQMKEGDITKPIKYPNGYLLLKINKKRGMKQFSNIDKELDELVKFEINKQLTQFSLLYFKKLKQNSIINEY